jgi:hypothetical protein
VDAFASALDLGEALVDAGETGGAVALDDAHAPSMPRYSGRTSAVPVVSPSTSRSVAMPTWMSPCMIITQPRFTVAIPST